MTSVKYPSIKAGTDSLKLNTGATVPILGLGTWRSPDEEVTKAVEIALKAGIRHLDCAFAYDNEAAVGKGIKQSGIPREELFVTTKIWGTFHRRVEEGVDISLQRLGLNYVDLLLIHWPVALRQKGDEKIPLREDGSRDIDEERTLNETWKQMEELVAKGKARAIGVSNVSKPVMEDLLKTAKIVPASNQIELHPYLPEHELVLYLQSKGITPAAYSPLGSGAAPVLEDETIIRIAKAKGAEPAQVAIAWQAQRGVLVIPKSVTEHRIISNSKLITLTEEEMQEINELYKQSGKHIRTCMPPWGVDFKFDNYPPPGQKV
ncbi:hypothetical protein L7F22_009603 [Adiantum nelumboides]|nr:hypothetical protein [Adiantum nelumboides]